MEIKSLMYCYRLLTFCNMCDDSDEFVFPCFNNFDIHLFLIHHFFQRQKRVGFQQNEAVLLVTLLVCFWILGRDCH